MGERRLVESVKNQIMEKLNIPTNTDTELYRAKSATGELELMESDKTMKHYGIRPGVTLYLDRTISVRVRMITGDRSMSISIQTSHSIQEVKTKIQEQLGILPENQRLIFSGKLVKDNGTVRDYKIKNDDQIFVIRRVCQCNLLIKDSHSGQDLPVKVEPSYTVEQVKLIIGKVKGVPIQQQQLTFHNTLLDNSKTLKHYDIGSGSQLVLDVCQYIPGQIFIRTLAGKTITLDVSSSDTVEKVKSMIECKEGIPPSHQKLMFMGKQLRDGTLNACGVQNETTVDLFLCVSGGRKMEIYVKIMGVNTMTVEVETSNKVKELKSKIYKLNGISPDRQLLILAGTVLDDNQTLDDYNIQRESTLHLFVSDPKGEKTVCITVKTHTGKEICFNETINKSIEHLMSTIEEMEGIPKDCQRLFFNGELLDYRKLLSDYRFSGANVVYLEFSGQIQVFVEILSCVSSATVNRFVKKICLRVVKEMKVSSLKCLIEYREKIPVYSQTLLYGYKVMDDRKLLGDYNIQHWCILQLSLEKLHHAELEIRVETPSEPLDLLKLDMDTTIQEVKRSSRYLMDNCSIEEQCLYYGGTLLHNDKLLRDYMVTDGSVLHLLPPREFPVFVHATIKGAFTNVFIGVKTTDTIKAIKNRILGKANIPLENCLYLSSMLLVDSKTVGEYRITAACTLNSVCPGEIPIYIKTRFTSISFGVKPSKPIGTIMEKISHSPEMGVPQRLLFHQQLLTGNVVLQKKLISDLHISAGSTLTMVMPNEIDIYVCTPWGSTLTLVCHKDDKIRDVKGAIEEIEGIAVENQILPFSNDEKTLKEENVECSTYLDVGKN